MVSVLAFYSDDPNSNPAEEVYSFYSVCCLKRRKINKRGWGWPISKKIALPNAFYFQQRPMTELISFCELHWFQFQFWYALASDNYCSYRTSPTGYLGSKYRSQITPNAPFHKLHALGILQRMFATWYFYEKGSIGRLFKPWWVATFNECNFCDIIFTIKNSNSVVVVQLHLNRMSRVQIPFVFFPDKPITHFIFLWEKLPFSKLFF